MLSLAADFRLESGRNAMRSRNKNAKLRRKGAVPARPELLAAQRRASNASLESEFKQRADRWKRDTCFQSSLGAKFMHKDYQTIMAMGPAVIPLILARLKATREHWFWA